jgi:uncharacterized membrane protein YgcG
MKTLGWNRIASSLIGLILCLSGCGTYHYTQQKDSAYVRGADGSVLLRRIDGQYVDTIESGNSGKYVSPGRHTLDIACADSASRTEGVVIYPVNETVEADFEANHTYQFTMQEGLIVTLWDDTAGADKRVSIATWNFDDDAYQDNEVDLGTELAGSFVSRPPLNPGDKRVGAPGPGRGGPPSIPNRPRPTGGGGQRGGGGGHGSSGGSHSGGGGGGGGGHKK